MLEHYGVRGTALSWFSSYLSDRKYISVNGHTSDHLKILCVVPQGPVLCPLLYLICINDLPNVSKLLSFYLFADDTNIYYKSHALPDQSLSELDNFYQNDPERNWYTSFQHWCCQKGIRYFPTEFSMRATNVTVTVFQSF